MKHYHIPFGQARVIYLGNLLFLSRVLSVDNVEQILHGSSASTCQTETGNAFLCNLLLSKSRGN